MEESVKTFCITHVDEFLIHKKTKDKYYLFSQVTNIEEMDESLITTTFSVNEGKLQTINQPFKTWEEAMSTLWLSIGLFEEFEKRILDIQDYLPLRDICELVKAWGIKKI